MVKGNIRHFSHKVTANGLNRITTRFQVIFLDSDNLVAILVQIGFAGLVYRDICICLLIKTYNTFLDAVTQVFLVGRKDLSAKLEEPMDAK